MSEVNIAEIVAPDPQTTTVIRKQIDPQIDLGHLLLCDQDAVEFDSHVDLEANLRNLARDNTQLLINKIWELPISRVEDVIVAKLPRPTTILPREKPLPRPKPTTKWQKYSQLKGIHKAKRGRKIWDEPSQSWKPRWGYDRAKDNTTDWLIEVPDNAPDPNVDYFEIRQQAKQERVAKNELQRLRNISRSSGQPNTSSGPTLPSSVIPKQQKTTEQFSHELKQAREATASLGKFTPTLPKEKPPKNLGKKRQFLSNEGDLKSERQNQMQIWEKLNKSKPILNVEKAIGIVKKQKTSENKSDKSAGGKNRGKGSKRKQQAKAINKQKFRNRQTKGKH